MSNSNTIFEKALIAYLGSHMAFFPLASYAAPLQTDGTTQTTVEAAPNGVPVVNIADPNANGLSHNRFDQYNVDSNGVILNNSTDTCVNTQLGGYIYGNTNLNSNASVILNEVTSTSRSQLNGYTEIAGQAADLVIANPNGITINGAGFINTNGVTLTTGRPNIVNGALDSLSIGGGDIAIEGAGLNNLGASSTHIYTQYLRLNALLHAQDLDIKLGNNTVGYTDKTIRASQNSGATGLLLDSSALGGMYANRITLVGTDQGLGVNLPPEVVASIGDINISNDGNVTLQTLNAKQQIDVATTGDLNLDGQLYAGSDATLNATGAINASGGVSAAGNTFNINADTLTVGNSAILMAGLNSDGTLNGGGALSVNSNSIGNSGTIQSTNTLDMTAANTLTNAGNLKAGGLLTANAATLNNTSGTLLVGSADITTNHFENFNGSAAATNDLALMTNTIDLGTGGTSNFYAGNDLTLTVNDTAALDNHAGSTIGAGNNLTLTTGGAFSNNADLLANGTLTLNTKALTNNATMSGGNAVDITADSLSNSATISGGSGVSTLDIAGNIDNTSAISAQGDLNVNGVDVTNSGYFSTGNDLTITSANITNNTTLFAGNDMNLYTTGTLANNQGANIIAVNNIFMGAAVDGSRTDTITNYAANIESLNGDIAIYANAFNNLATDPVVQGTFFNQGDIYMSLNIFGTPWDIPAPYDLVVGGVDTPATSPVQTNPCGSNCYDTESTSTSSMVLNDRGIAASLQADAGNITIDVAGTVLNKYSSISAGGDGTTSGNIMINAATVDNQSLNIMKVLTTTTQHYVNQKYCAKWTLGFCTRNGYRAKASGSPVTTSSSQVIDTVASTIQASGNVTINASVVGNGGDSGVAPSSSSIAPSGLVNTPVAAGDGGVTLDITLPTNDYGLFVTSRDPDSQYLIETNPEFVLESNFLSSDYFMENIGFSPESTVTTTKRLGDAFYENKLVRDSILEQTGRRFLTSDIKDDNQQYQYLMDNAIAAQEDLLLIPGVALTNAQIHGLKKDIVWMEEKEVAGQKVLVPVVYIASADDYKLQGGKIIAGDEIHMQVAELANAGLMEAGGNMQVTATDAITNYGGEMHAGDDLSLTAVNDIENVSGTIAASNVVLTSTEGDIINRRTTETISDQNRNTSYSATVAGEAGNIIATNNLALDAANGVITIEGSNLSASDMSLNAVTVDIVATEESTAFSGRDSNSSFNRQTSTHLGSNLTGENIAINSSGATTVEGSNISADGQLTIAASQLDVIAVNDTSYYEDKTSYSDFLSSEKKERKIATSTNIGSTLAGGDINLTTTEGDITVVGSSAAAENTLALNSAGDITVQAGYDGKMNESKTEKSGFGGGDFYSESVDLEGRMATTAVQAQLSGNKVEINAANDLTLTGVEVAANEISGSAENINIENVYDEETTWSKHEKISVSLGDVAKTMTDPSALIKTEGGKVSFKLAEADYSNIENSTTTKTVVGSSLDANDITLNAGSESEEGGNINITGSDLVASDTIALLATGDVDIKEAKNTEESKTKEQIGHGELNLTVKNEYVEIATALETAKAAEKALNEAKKSYNNYKKELARQKDHLAQLKQDLADGKLGIEQSDIDELATYIDDLKSDDAYYQANIALAATDLATKTAAVATQMATAAASSGTYGFNVGVEMDLDLLEKRYGEYKEQSVASNLVANNITINAGGDTTIRGSNLAANDIGIETENLNILASQDLSTSHNSSEHLHTNVSVSVYGGSGTSVSASADRSQGGSSSITHTNSQLQGNTITLKTRDTTTIAGANVAAADTLSIDTRNLNVESVQDSHKSRSAGEGINVSGSAGSIPGSTGINGSVSHNRSRETVLTTLTGGNVDINVAEETTLTGATIAAMDAEGNDTGNLSLKTGTLQVNALSNTSYSTATSANVGMGSTVSIDASSDTSHSKTKTLGTIGEGNIQVANIEESDTKLLNRDVQDNEVDIYDIESHKGLKGSLDTRFLTEQGRDQIAEDVMKSGMIVDTIKLIVTTDKVGIEDFFSETDKSHTTYETVKETIAKDPNLAAMLQDPNLSAQDKEAMLNQVTAAVMEKLGYTAQDNKIVAQDDGLAGHYDRDSNTAYINDQNNDSTGELVTTAGHEMAHAMDNQDKVNDTYSQADRETYANTYGDNFASYTDMALDINGYDSGMASSNNHTGNDSGYVKSNTRDYNALNKMKGDSRLTEVQQAAMDKELEACTNDLCRTLTQTKYAYTSTKQGIEEAAGAVTGAVEKTINDIVDLANFIDEVYNDPERAEQMAENAGKLLLRLKELEDGGKLTEQEKTAIKQMMQATKEDLQAKIEDASKLDGEGVADAFGEGKKEGTVIAGVIGISKLKKALKIIERAEDLGVDLPDGKDLKLLPETIPPRGFKDAEQYNQSMKELAEILEQHGIDDASVRIRGSSTTGFSKNPNKSGKFFDDNPDKPSDIDIAIESQNLADRLSDAGQNPSRNIDGLYLPGKIENADADLANSLKQWEAKWSSELGRSIEPAVNDPRLVKPDITDVTTKLGE